jgi:hypothetical protein
MCGVLFISGMPGFRSRGDSMINGNISEVTSPATLFAEQRIPYRSGAAVYPWNAAFNREYPAVLLTPLWLTKPHFHAALLSQVAIFGNEAVRSGSREEMPASSGLVPFCTTARANRKGISVCPYGDDFQERLAAHWANLNTMKWMLWNDGVEMAEFGMIRVRNGLFQHARRTQKQTMSDSKGACPQEHVSKSMSAVKRSVP